MTTAESRIEPSAVLQEAPPALQEEQPEKTGKKKRWKTIGTIAWITALVLIAGWLLFPVHSDRINNNYETWRAPLYMVVRWNFPHANVQKVSVYAFPNTMKAEETIWDEVEAPQVGRTFSELEGIESLAGLKMAETNTKIYEWQLQENKKQNTENFKKRTEELEKKKQAETAADR